MPRYSEKAKLIAAAVFGGVVVISGAATAATGSLPLVSHGHSHPTNQTPDVNDDQGDDTGDVTGDDTGTTDTTDTPDASQPDNHGSDVSTAAHDATGAKGKTVCAVASEQRCVLQGQSAGHRQNGADSHGNGGTNTNATTHRQNGLTTHGKAGANTTATTHRQNGLTTHGQAGLHSHTSG